jgi:hypothetical protein
MKKIIRIPFGIILCPITILMGSIMWLFEERMNYSEVLELNWYLVSGQWNKLPD